MGSATIRLRQTSCLPNSGQKQPQWAYLDHSKADVGGR